MVRRLITGGGIALVLAIAGMFVPPLLNKAPVAATAGTRRQECLEVEEVVNEAVELGYLSPEAAKGIVKRCDNIPDSVWGRLHTAI